MEDIIFLLIFTSAVCVVLAIGCIIADWLDKYLPKPQARRIKRKTK